MRSREVGAVSLLFTAVFMSVVALLAVSFLYSLRYGHWPMQDMWDRWTRQAKIENIQQEIKGVTAQSGMPSANEVRRCVIAGKVVYSNVDCRDDSSGGNSGSKAVKLYDSRGIEAPKQAVQPEAQSDAGMQTDKPLADKVLEKAVSGKSK